MAPALKVQVMGKGVTWDDLELPFDRLPGMVRVVIDGLRVDVARRDGAVDIFVAPDDEPGNVALDVQGVYAHDMQAHLRVKASRKPAGYHRDDEGRLV